MVKSQVLEACRHLLAPVVRLLIRNGVTWNEFSELGKAVYVDVARRDYGLQGRPTNSARVALLTGLSRREVGRVKNLLLSTEPGIDPEAPQDRISRILASWHLDPDFHDATGTPLPLPETGAEASIETLFKRYAGDTPHGALLKELLRLGLVVPEDDHYRVTARSYVRAQTDPNMVHQAGVALHDHGATVVHNCNAERSGPPRFDRMATSLSFPAEHADRFRQLVEQKGQLFLEQMDRWLSDHEDDPPSEGNARSLRIGVGLYFIHDDSQGTSKHE